jgi:hypothetical protein
MHERPRYLVAICPRRPQRGSGSGLSVVRLLIEAMDERLQVAAHPRGGADVQRLLPIARTQQLGGAIRDNTETVRCSTDVPRAGWVDGLGCGRW